MLASPCILAFDTATGPASVAVWKHGTVAAYLETPASGMQSAQLVPMIERALKDSHITYKQLTAVACTIGPGSFTGIRTGLATARGICLATGLPGMGFTTLEVLGHAGKKQKPTTPILAILNAGKGEQYYQGFSDTPLFEPQLGVMTAAAAKMPPDFTTVGNAMLPGTPALPVSFPRADVLAELAAACPKHASLLTPFYIRPPDAKPLVKSVVGLV